MQLDHPPPTNSDLGGATMEALMSRIAAAGPLAAPATPHTMAAAIASPNAGGRPPLGAPAWLADFLDSVELEVQRIQQQSISK